MRKPELGEVLYSLNVGNAARRIEQKLTPVEVIKIGRKYFTCRPVGKVSKYSEVEYRIEDWGQKTDYSAESELYQTEQEYLDEREASEIRRLIKQSLGDYGAIHKLDLDALRQIARIINGESECKIEAC